MPLIALTAVLGAVGLLLRGAADVAPDHVIVILLDTVRPDGLGCYGGPAGATPNIDALAADGVRFDQAISSSGWTLPAVASLLTGTWPTIHGATGKRVTLTPIRDGLRTAGEVLQGAGFKTLALTNAAFVSPLLHLDRGFDVFDHRHAFNWDVRRADETVDAAIKLLRLHQTERTFLLIHLFDPHLDYDPPPGYADRFTGGRAEPAQPLKMKTCLAMRTEGGEAPPTPDDIRYIKGVHQGEIAFLDAQIGRLIAELKERQLYDSAMLIVVADHGEEFWDHGGFEHGHTLYDELIRVPLIVKLPGGHRVGGRVVKDQVRVLDVMPTVFDLLDIEGPDTFVGESLMPLIKGESSPDRFAFSESTLYGADKLAWRGDRYKYILDLTADEVAAEELYDWRRDPGETTNLIDRLPEVASKLKTTLLDFYGALQDRAANMTQNVEVDMSPRQIEVLKSLGYIR